MKVLWQALANITIYHLIITFLLILTIIGGFKFDIETIYWQVGIVLVSTVIFGSFFDYLETKRWVLTPGPIISGLIIGLVGQFGGGFVDLVEISFLAMAIKYFIKVFGRNIFNPAGAGLFVGSLFFNSLPSWWIGGTPFWVFYIWMAILILKLKRWAPIVAFLIPSVLLGGIGVLSSSTILFFVSVMLIEIKTSPNQIRYGLIYGLVVALVSYGLAYLSWPVDSLITGLLFGNLTYLVLQKLNYPFLKD